MTDSSRLSSEKFSSEIESLPELFISSRYSLYSLPPRIALIEVLKTKGVKVWQGLAENEEDRTDDILSLIIKKIDAAPFSIVLATRDYAENTGFIANSFAEIRVLKELQEKKNKPLIYVQMCDVFEFTSAMFMLPPGTLFHCKWLPDDRGHFSNPPVELITIITNQYRKSCTLMDHLLMHRLAAENMLATSVTPNIFKPIPLARESSDRSGSWNAFQKLRMNRDHTVELVIKTLQNLVGKEMRRRKLILHVIEKFKAFISKRKSVTNTNHVPLLQLENMNDDIIKPSAILSDRSTGTDIESNQFESGEPLSSRSNLDSIDSVVVERDVLMGDIYSNCNEGKSLPSTLPNCNSETTHTDPQPPPPAADIENCEDDRHGGNNDSVNVSSTDSTSLDSSTAESSVKDTSETVQDQRKKRLNSFVQQNILLCTTRHLRRPNCLKKQVNNAASIKHLKRKSSIDLGNIVKNGNMYERRPIKPLPPVLKEDIKSPSVVDDEIPKEGHVTDIKKIFDGSQSTSQVTSNNLKHQSVICGDKSSSDNLEPLVPLNTVSSLRSRFENKKDTISTVRAKVPNSKVVSLKSTDQRISSKIATSPKSSSPGSVNKHALSNARQPIKSRAENLPVTPKSPYSPGQKVKDQPRQNNGEFPKDYSNSRPIYTNSHISSGDNSSFGTRSSLPKNELLKSKSISSKNFASPSSISTRTTAESISPSSFRTLSNKSTSISQIPSSTVCSSLVAERLKLYGNEKIQPRNFLSRPLKNSNTSVADNNHSSIIDAQSHSRPRRNTLAPSNEDNKFSLVCPDKISCLLSKTSSKNNQHDSKIEIAFGKRSPAARSPLIARSPVVQSTNSNAARSSKNIVSSTSDFKTATSDVNSETSEAKSLTTKVKNSHAHALYGGSTVRSTRKLGQRPSLQENSTKVTLDMSKSDPQNSNAEVFSTEQHEVDPQPTQYGKSYSCSLSSPHRLVNPELAESKSYAKSVQVSKQKAVSSPHHTSIA